MTKEEMIELAKQAGFERLGHTAEDWVCHFEDIEEFTKLVADKERERIFDLLHEMHVKAKGQHNHYLHAVVTLKQRGEA